MAKYNFEGCLCGAVTGIESRESISQYLNWHISFMSASHAFFYSCGGGGGGVLGP
jgi:hypothetical protein